MDGSLRPAILKLRPERSRRSSIRQKGSESDVQWVGLVRLTLLRLQLGVAYVEGIRTWSTNEFDATLRITKQFISWSQVKGENARLPKQSNRYW